MESLSSYLIGTELMLSAEKELEESLGTNKNSNFEQTSDDSYNADPYEDYYTYRYAIHYMGLLLIDAHIVLLYIKQCN